MPQCDVVWNHAFIKITCSGCAENLTCLPMIKVTGEEFPVNPAELADQLKVSLRAGKNKKYLQNDVQKFLEVWEIFQQNCIYGRKKSPTTKLIILFSLSSELQVCQRFSLPFFNLLSRNMSLPQE